MSTGTLLAIIIPIVVVLIILGLVWRVVARRRHLRDRFGPEYDRTLQTEDSRRAGERELLDREQRHDTFEIKELPSTARERYAQDWNNVQEQFVDRPDEAVKEADQLVTTLMSERGYPTDRYEQQIKDLSVEHGQTLQHYRTAHEINVRSTHQRTSTEDLRLAMVHYRALFDDLLENQSGRPHGNRA